VAVAGLGDGVLALAAGNHHTCALTASRASQCWGFGPEGQLGDGTRNNRLTPVAVAGLGDGVLAIAAGGYHTCAFNASRFAHCWGSNKVGQLGDGTQSNRYEPTLVAAFDPDMTTQTSSTTETPPSKPSSTTETPASMLPGRMQGGVPKALGLAAAADDTTRTIGSYSTRRIALLALVAGLLLLGAVRLNYRWASTTSPQQREVGLEGDGDKYPQDSLLTAERIPEDAAHEHPCLDAE